MNWRWWLCKIIGHRWKPRSLYQIQQDSKTIDPSEWETKLPIVKCERCGATEP